MAKAVASADATAALTAPISERTSEVERLSNPLAVNLAYSSSATEALSILTALVFDIPNVKEACAPISERTSDAERPSIVVPSIRRKSSSTAPLVKVATFPLEIPLLGTSDVKATVPVEVGKVTVTSPVVAGPINVTLLVPLSLSSKNSKKPALVAPFFNCIPALAIGVVRVLFVRVSVVALPTSVSVAAGKVSVTSPEYVEWAEDCSAV